jgi:hypothetical protein
MYMETPHFDKAPEKEPKEETVVDKMKRILGIATLAAAGAAAQAPAQAQEALDYGWTEKPDVTNVYDYTIHSYDSGTTPPGWDEPTPQYGDYSPYKGFNPEDAPGTSSGEEKPEGDKQ